MERVTGIGGFFFRTDDPGRSARWYAEHLSVSVEVDPEACPDGRFASLRDPDGNVVQLWEPAGADARGPGGD